MMARPLLSPIKPSIVPLKLSGQPPRGRAVLNRARTANPHGTLAQGDGKSMGRKGDHRGGTQPAVMGVSLRKDEIER